jgi:putative membrane protein
MVDILIRFLCLTTVVYGVSLLVPGMRLRSFKTAFSVSAVYGLLNFLLFKVLVFITFPLLILKWLTLGLFGVVLNAVLLLAADKLLDDFELDGFSSAFWAAVLISLANLLVAVFL